MFVLFFVKIVVGIVKDGKIEIVLDVSLTVAEAVDAEFGVVVVNALGAVMYTKVSLNKAWINILHVAMEANTNAPISPMIG